MNKFDNKIQNGGLFCNGKFSLFQRLVVHYELKFPCKLIWNEYFTNTRYCCQLMKQDIFKGLEEDEAYVP